MLFQNFNLRSILIGIPVLIIAFTVHELCHGLAAYKLGDDTAKFDGRLSLNPLRHIDPLGFISILLLGFGWARPVMVNPAKLKNPKVDMGLISAAGPISNLLMAFISLLILFPLSIYGQNLLPATAMDIIAELLLRGCVLNISLCVFNLIPIPPLDGSKIFAGVLPDSLYYKVMSFQRYGMPLLMILVWTGAIDKIMGPFTGAMLNLLMLAVGKLFGV